jgi:hypothetical protein
LEGKEEDRTAQREPQEYCAIPQENHHNIQEEMEDRNENGKQGP